MNEKTKLLLMILIMLIIIVSGMLIYTSRIEKIENGTFELVSDSEMDR